MSVQPTGTVTFLFTDIEGSTRRWDQDAEGMGSALAHHDAIVRSAVEQHRGFVFATGGDGFAVAFGVPNHAVACAVSVQIALDASGLPPVRMGVHTGTAVERDGDYFGPDVNRAARLMAVAHGGQVLLSGAAAQLADAYELRDLGEHRLRDLSRPEQVFQVCADGLNDDFPPLRSLDAHATNLPIELTTFVGRDDDVKRLVALVAEHRLVTVTGVGGVGKTRLALQAAAEVFGRFSDGVWLCELAAADDASALCEVVATSLGVKRVDASGLDAICEHLRNRSALVVLDNCEHLLDDVADAVEAILHRAPLVHVLATSREGLAVAGEQIQPLRSLEVPRSNSGFADTAACPAVRLFLDRALAAAPSFAINQANANAVAEICRRLDGIPLAIELAAARVAALRVSEIAALLDERFRLLTGRRGRGVERHQTLRAAVDWSYSLLREREQQLFDRLGVFSGSFDAEAAHAVAGADLDRIDVLEILGELVAKSMVTVDDSDLATSRYRQLETLRQYALERLESREETDELRRRHVRHYAAFAREAGPGLTGSRELEWRPRVRAEIDNLRSAVGWSLDCDDRADMDPALEIIAALAFEAVGYRASGIGQWAERAMSTRAVDGSAHKARVAVVASYGAFHRLDFSTARQYAEMATARATDVGTRALADALLGNLAATTGNTAEAARIDVEALARLDASDTVGWERFTLVPAALFAMICGDAEQGNDIADSMLAHGRALGWPTGLAIALYAKGFTNQERAPDVALKACNESIELTEQGASDVVYGHCYIVCGAVHRNAGEIASAAAEFADAITYSLDIGDLIEVGSALSFAVPMLVRAGEPDAGVVIGAGMVDGPFSMLTFNAAAPTLQAEFDAALETARRQLGEAQYEQARSRGAAMTMDELVAVVLHALRALA